MDIDYSDFDHFTRDQLKEEAKKMGLATPGLIGREKLIERIVKASQEALTAPAQEAPQDTGASEVQAESTTTGIETVKEVYKHAEKESVLQDGQAKAVIDKVFKHYEEQHRNGVHRIRPADIVSFEESKDGRGLDMRSKRYPEIRTQILLMQPISSILRECDTFYRVVSAAEWDKSNVKAMGDPEKFAPVSIRPGA